MKTGKRVARGGKGRARKLPGQTVAAQIPVDPGKSSSRGFFKVLKSGLRGDQVPGGVEAPEVSRVDHNEGKGVLVLRG